MTDAPPDYTTMSGAEFQRAVGVDPEKWAEAYVQKSRDQPAVSHAEHVERLRCWFADAMEAARKAHVSHVFERNADTPE